MNKKTVRKLFLLVFFIVGLFPAFLLCGCSPVDQGEVISSLLPNLWVFLTHIFSTIVLLTICIWLVWKPTKESLTRRREYIQNEIKVAEQTKEKTILELANVEKTTFEALHNAKQIIDNANIQAHLEKEKIELEAKENSLRTKEDANNEAIKIKERMKTTMRSEILDIAFAASESLLKNKITKKENDAFVNDFINSINKKKGTK